MIFLKNWIRLIRIENLLMILLTEWVVKWALIDLVLKESRMEYRMSDSLFWLLAGSSLLIATSGYIYNDIKDAEADQYKLSLRPIAQGLIAPKPAGIIAQAMNVVAVLLAFTAAVMIYKPGLAGIPLLAMSLLFGYSRGIKCMGMLGNFLIATTIALVPLMIWIFAFYDPKHFGLLQSTAFIDLHISVFFIAGFAFLATLLREWVKDREDREADQKVGCYKWAGMNEHSFTKGYSLVTLMLILLIALFQELMPNSFLPMKWILFVVALALLTLNLKAWIQSENQSQLSKWSLYLKLVLLIGLLSPLIQVFR